MLFLDFTVIDNSPIKELAEISIRLVKLRQLNQQVSNVKGEIITAKRKIPLQLLITDHCNIQNFLFCENKQFFIWLSKRQSKSPLSHCKYCAKNVVLA